ncbi:cytochrome c oxidase subunit II [Posidoniimonas corsicana]|nr:cytochrome c oxidase subunit II [Posidoniimonas corsicana]
MTSPALLADWFRPGASTTAHYVDNLFYVISVICVFFFVLIIAMMAWFMWKYRARPGHREEHTAHHNNALEITWSVIPLILAIWIFFQGFVGYVAMRNTPQDAYEIEVIAQKWSWSFVYPTGAISPELHVPKDQPVKLILSSRDVIHSLYIPAFRVKMDCVPGRYNEMWFEATTASDEVKDPTWDNDQNNPELKYTDGSATYDEAAATEGYDLFCTEYCGTSHSSMITKCIVHDEAGFQEWMKKAMDPRSQGTPVEVGKQLYNRRGCAQCHTIDGTDRPGPGGPSFKGHYGETVTFKDGSTGKMDDNYIRESILNPQAKIRQGYNPIMPTFQGQLNEDEIFALRQYIRSLNDEEVNDWAPKEGEEGEEAEGESEEASADGPATPQEESAGDAEDDDEAPATAEQPATTDEADNADPEETESDD